jgi:threonyl-tRNA synthetase
MNDLILSIYEDFGFPDVTIKFSDRPDKRIGDDAVWDRSEAALMQALKTSGRPWTLNKGEGAFYGPKLEYVLRDAIGRDWQCGTVQVDLNMPGRLGAFYIDEHSNKVTPVMLHRAMFGSLERFIGILIEHHGGHLPLWLSPLQAVVATITDDADAYARDVTAAAQRAGCGSRPTCGTRKSITRCASTRSPRCRRCSWSAARKQPTAPFLSAVSDTRDRPCWRSMWR